MTTLINQIKTNRVDAMRDKTEAGKAKLSTLRLLVAELEKEKVQHKLADVTGLSDEQVQTVINRQIKKLDKEIESYVAVGRGVEKQEAEKALLNTYLPKQLTTEEIAQQIKVIVDVVKTAGGNIGIAMKEASAKMKGKADMKLVSELVKEGMKK